MSTEVNNPQVQEQQEPVLVLDDKKYVISELSDEAKYIVACLNSLTAKETEFANGIRPSECCFSRVYRQTKRSC